MTSSVPINAGVGDAIALNARFLYLQGLWYEDSAPSSRVLRHLRLGHPILSMVGCVIQTLIICPTTIFLYWETKSVVFENLYSLLLTFIIGTIFAKYYFQKERFREVMLQLKEIDIEKNLDTEKQISILNRTKKLCYMLTRINHLILFPCVVLFTAVYFVFYLIPNGETFNFYWHPYNEKISPAYELTLFVRFLHFESICLIALTDMSTTVTILAHLDMMFSILVDKMENIFEISTIKVESRKVEELNRARQMERVPEEYQLPRFQIVSEMSNEIQVRHDGEIHNLSSELKNEGDNSLNLPTYPKDFSNQVQRDITFGKLLEQTKRAKDVEVKEVDAGIEVDSDEGDLSAEIEEEVKSQLKVFVKLHQQLYRLSTLIATIYNKAFLNAFLFNICTYGVTVLNVSTAEIWTMKEIGIIIMALNAAFAFLVYNYLANQITDQSRAVGEAMYSSDWLRSSKHFKTSMLIVMVRANNPVQFKPTGIDPLSLKLFGEVTNHAYKLLATLRDVLK